MPWTSWVTRLTFWNEWINVDNYRKWSQQSNTAGADTFSLRDWRETVNHDPAAVWKRADFRWYQLRVWWQKQRKMEAGSWGWRSGSDRPEWAPLGLHIRPGQPRALPLAPGPSLFHRDCLMLCNEPHNTPRWPSGDFGGVPSAVLLPPLLTSTISSHQHHLTGDADENTNINHTDGVDERPCCLSCSSAGFTAQKTNKPALHSSVWIVLCIYLVLFLWLLYVLGLGLC